jgi:hypothetical protein
MWAWDKKLARYRDSRTGRFLSQKTVLGYVTDSISRAGVATDQLARFASSGVLKPSDWSTAFRGEIKTEYIQKYLLGRGGREQMTQADWGRIGGMLKEQYRHLPDFQRAIAEGELSEAQIAARSRMYINSAREGYERATAEAAKRAGKGEVRWRVNAAAENCPDCLAFEALGWRPVESDPFSGAYPGSGATQCLTNCQCNLDYRSSTE